MDDQRPDAMRTLLRHLAKVLPLRLADMAEDVAAVSGSGASEVAAWRAPSKTVSEFET